MQNRDYTYTFANIVEGEHEENLQMYGLTNRSIQRINPERWMNNFKSIFDNFGGALVIILKNDSYAQLNQILDIYGKWALMNIPKGVDLKATTLEWVMNSKYNQDNSEKNYTFRTLIKGQLIIVSGLFPDIYIDLHAEFGWEAVDTNKICSYMQIAILQFLLRRIYSSFSCIQDDIDEMLERIGNTVPLRIAYLNDYFRSRRSDLSELSTASSRAREILVLIKSNLKYYGTCSTPINVIIALESGRETRTNEAAQLIVKLDNTVCMLQQRRRNFLNSFKLGLRRVYIGTVTLWVAISFFVHDEESAATRYTLIGIRSVTIIGIIIDIIIVIFVDKQRFKLTKNEKV